MNLKGMAPRLIGGDKIREIGLWSKTVEGIAREVGRRSFCNKVERTRYLSNLATTCPIPVLIFLHVYSSFFNGIFSRSIFSINSSIFSPKGSLTFVPPCFSDCDLVVLKSPAMMRYFPRRSSFSLLRYS